MNRLRRQEQGPYPETTLAQEYGVIGIPHLFLFGPDGKVLQDGKRGDGIDAALKPIFQK
jgi:hypothetical protein